jgi:hypothetical protein
MAPLVWPRTADRLEKYFGRLSRAGATQRADIDRPFADDPCEVDALMQCGRCWRFEPVIAGVVAPMNLRPSRSGLITKRPQSLSKGHRPKRSNPPTAAAYKIASTFSLRSAPSIRNSALRAAIPMSLVLVFPVVAVSPIWNRHFHKPGSIKKRVNSTPFRVMIPPALLPTA